MSVVLEGGDEIRSLSVAFCDEIIPHQTVTFLSLKWVVRYYGVFILKDPSLET
jgi:hypothetical protein